MREFIIKHFALYHNVFIYGKKISFLRAAIPMWNSLLLIILVVSNTDYPDFTLIDWIVSIPFIVSAYLGTTYFKFKPIKWEELEDEQKWDLGKIKPIYAHSLEGVEWKNIDEKFSKIKNRKIGYLLVNFIILIITIILFLSQLNYN